MQNGQIVRPTTATGRLWLGRTGTTKVTDGLVAFSQELKVRVTSNAATAQALGMVEANG